MYWLGAGQGIVPSADAARRSGPTEDERTRMRTSALFSACTIAVGALSVAVSAQSAPPPSASEGGTPPTAVPASSPAPVTPPAAAPASSEPTPQPAAASPAGEAEGTPLQAPAIARCVPSCRTGFTCVGGSCVSSCNPPCSIGDVCTAQAECIAKPLAPLPGDEVAARLEAGVEMHDGFFLRLTTGPAGGAVSLDVPDLPERTYSGGGWSSSIDIGGGPVRDLVIFGRLRGAWLFDPKVRDGNAEVDLGAAFNVTQGLIGAGINYYVMPLNIYFGGAIGFATITTARDRPGQVDDVRQASDVGFGIDLDAGKEWWVGDNWGIGVALRLSLASVPAGNDIARDAVFGSGFVSIVFSATYQ
jgi:hypothetical protein